MSVGTSPNGLSSATTPTGRPTLGARSTATTRTGPQTRVGRSTVTTRSVLRTHGPGTCVGTTPVGRTTRQDGLQMFAVRTRGGRTQARTCGETTPDGRTRVLLLASLAGFPSAVARPRGTKHQLMYTGSRTSRLKRRIRGRRVACHPGGDGSRARRGMIIIYETVTRSAL